MGVCHATHVESKLISKCLEKDHEKQGSIKKLLFLGPGDSGKSTLYKQLVTLYGRGYETVDRMAFISNIHRNVVESIKALVLNALEFSSRGLKESLQGETLDCSLDGVDCELLSFIESHPIRAIVSPEAAQKIKNVWDSQGIQNTRKLTNFFQFPFDDGHFIGKRLDDVCSPDYVPTLEDILRSRTRTTGILETDLNIDNEKFYVVDVGGQRSERKKWIHCFEEVTGVIFVASLGDYDLKLFEDESINRMEEALNLFEEISGSRWFRETSIILFLNKSDIFREKIKYSPLNQCPLFEDYDGEDPPGPDGYEFAIKYITKQFEDKSSQVDRAIYTHVTCARDADNVDKVFRSVKDIIMRHALRMTGMIL